MKIAVLISSQNEKCSSLTDDNKYRNLFNFGEKHDIDFKFIDKINACKQLDEIKKQGFDLWINLMRGQDHDDVAGIDATLYAETLGVSIIGVSSKSLSLSKIDFKKNALASNVRTPQHPRDKQS